MSFNPRARVGRDVNKTKGMKLNVQFQSTRPRGARRAQERDREIEQEVSIHAPAWGATVGAHKSQSGLMSFNPRARVGRDFTKVASKRNLESFNPRARVGRDVCRIA